MIINCVVVTYNRLSLLKENLNALKGQTYPINKIFVINNNSTDGTREWLDSLKHDTQLKIIHLQKNIGGAGGFYEGIKRGILAGCDYIWIMDDDTIPAPDALSELIKGCSLTDKVGFVCSKVIWTDQSIHQMNFPEITTSTQREPVIYRNQQTKGILCHSCSFVSVMFSSEAVFKAGLPIKEFFIWADDIEYTSRIYKLGYKGLYMESSVVVHKTISNYGSKIQTAPVEMAWKFYYHARNNTYLQRSRKRNLLSYYISILNKYRVYLHRINKRTDSKENKQKFREAVRKGCKDGIRFHPTIEYLQRPQ